MGCTLMIWEFPHIRDIRFGAPHSKDDGILGSLLGCPLFWETVFRRKHQLFMRELESVESKIDLHAHCSSNCPISESETTAIMVSSWVGPWDI